MTPGAEQTLQIPAGAVVTDVQAHVKAAGIARWTTIGAVAQVRSHPDVPPLAASAVVVDFGGRVTVSGLHLDSGWSFLVDGETSRQLVGPLVAGQANHLASFPATTTSRLIIGFGGASVPSQVAVAGSVDVALPAADLEIFVNANRAWSRPGPAEPGLPDQAFLGDPGLTGACQEELDAGRTPLRVRLRSRTPATLDLTLTGSYLHSHKVEFAEGPMRSVDATTESRLTVDVALPSEARVDTIEEVHATVTARTGPERVVPADGPPLSPDAALIIDADRAASVRLPAATGSLATLAGVRLPLHAGSGGAELRGVLRSGSAEEPGAVLPRGSLGPATLEAGAGVRWVSLLLPKPQKPPAGPIWLDVIVTRGSVEWPLATAAGTPVRRPTPGGTYRRIATVSGVDTDAAVRIIGVPLATAPVFPVDVGAAGAAPAGVVVRGTTADITLVFPDGASTASDTLRLVLTASTAGTFTLSDVSVDYDRTAVKAP